MKLSSFSGARWKDFAPHFGLYRTLESNQFEEVVTPVYHLPPSVHKIMFEAAWITQDVYQERQQQRREAARVRILDPWLVRIIALFQGRIIDKPEQDMVGTEYASGGEIEHEIFMIGGILFFIVQLKLDMSLEDNVAQLFVELLSAAKANDEVDFGNLRIYGLLTDLTNFHFYSYNPLTKEFAFDNTLVVNITRDLAFLDMIPVCDKIFSFILTAYIDGLEATMFRSAARQETGDVSSPGSQQRRSRMALLVSGPVAGPSKHYTRSHIRKSVHCWEVALQFAQQCRDKFNEPVATIDDIEVKSTTALELLATSVQQIPRASLFTGTEEPLSINEVRKLADRMIRKKYMNPNQLASS